jgi:CBS domain containing-hemolysin-like protein
VSPQLALVLVVVLIAANGLFVAAEFALVAVRRPAIEDAAQEGDRGARRVLRELQHLSFVLSAAQFGITVTSLLVGFLAEGAIGDTLVVPVVEALGLPPESSRGVSIATAFLLSTGLQMVVGELAPKNLAIARPEAVSRATAPAIRVFGALLGPVIRVFDGAAAWMTERVFGVEVADELAGGHTLDELGRIIEASSDEGALSDQQAELLTRAVGLWDRRASEILVPAPDVQWLEAAQPVDDLRRASRDTGHSRFPVRDGDDILGTVHVKDLLGAEQGRTGDGRAPTMRDLATSCLIVPESEPLRRLLATFRAHRRTFAVVVDEYGSVAGILTLEDLLEQLVGDIEDEFDRERVPAVRRVGRGRFRVAGSLRVERFADAVGVELPDGDYETVAGLVMHDLGRIPESGETLQLDGVSLTVTRMEGVRIAEVEARWQARDGGGA